nr:hypothetical protein CFP56_67732 [Quercus suber]
MAGVYGSSKALGFVTYLSQHCYVFHHYLSAATGLKLLQHHSPIAFVSAAAIVMTYPEKPIASRPTPLQNALHCHPSSSAAECRPGTWQLLYQPPGIVCPLLRCTGADRTCGARSAWGVLAPPPPAAADVDVDDDDDDDDDVAEATDLLCWLDA